MIKIYNNVKDNNPLFITKIKKKFVESCNRKYGIPIIIANFFVVAIIISFYPFMPFLSYMQFNNIFSYDFFTGGNIAIYVFSLSILLLLLSFSVMLTIGLINFIIVKIKKIEYKEMTIIFFILNLVTTGLFICVALVQEEITLWISFLLIISFFLSIHVLIYKYYFVTNPEYILASNVFIMLFAIPMFFVVIFAEQSSTLTSITLKKFGVADLNIVVLSKQKNKDNKECINGELILLSPNTIYIKNTDGITITLNRSEYEIYTSKDEKTLQKTFNCNSTKKGD